MDILGVVSSLLTGQKTEPAAQGQSVVQNLLSPKKAENSKSTDVSSANAIGVMQVREPVLNDFNKRFGTSFVMENLKNDKINEQIGNWYWNDEIPRLLEHYDVPATSINKLLAYNAGPSLAAKRIKNGYVEFKNESFNYLIKSYDKEFGLDASQGINVFIPKYEIAAKKVQQKLKEYGLYEGKIDGKFGPKSKQALIKWIENKNNSEALK